MKNLQVLYKSQWDADAGGTNNDCGPCAVAQILNFYGEQVTTNDVFKRTAAGAGLISWQQLINAISFFGYTPVLERNSNLDRVRELINQDTPPILLVHYGSLKSTQDKNFKGGHFFAIVGCHDGGFYVNDSNFKGPQRSEGDHHNYETAEIDKAWKDCTIDKNQAYSLLWIKRKTLVVTGSTNPITDQTRIPQINNDEVQKIKGDIDAKNKYIYELEHKEPVYTYVEKPVEVIVEKQVIKEVPIAVSFTNPIASSLYALASLIERRSTGNDVAKGTQKLDA